MRYTWLLFILLSGQANAFNSNSTAITICAHTFTSCTDTPGNCTSALNTCVNNTGIAVPENPRECYRIWGKLTSLAVTMVSLVVLAIASDLLLPMIVNKIKRLEGPKDDKPLDPPKNDDDDHVIYQDGKLFVSELILGFYNGVLKFAAIWNLATVLVPLSAQVWSCLEAQLYGTCGCNAQSIS